MSSQTSVLRELGTSYAGKEPHEYTADIIRFLVRLAGNEFGFENCLTTRPFTSRTYVGECPGLMLPGRGDAIGADRVRSDLADALSLLREAGWRDDHVRLPAALSGSGGLALSGSGDRRAVIAGPLRADDRWCPVADRMLSGAAWRYVVAERLIGDDVLCFDPLYGGYTCVPARQLAADGVDAVRVTAPRVPPDAVTMARRCHAAGVAARTRPASAAAGAAAGAGRDAAGLLRCAEMAGLLSAGSPARRLFLSLQNQALQAFRWSCLLGYLDTGDIDALALADVLRDFVVTCRGALTATALRDAGQLERCLRQLAAWAQAADELSARLIEDAS